MQPTRRSFALILLLALPALLLSGCAAVDSLLYKREVRAVPGGIVGTNTTYVTNVMTLTNVATLTLTNQVTHEVTQTNVVTVTPQMVVTPQVTYTYAATRYETNLVERPEIKNAIEGGGGLVPIPGAGAIALGLGWLYSAYAAMRNKKAAVALVTGIEAGRRILQETPAGQALDAKVVQALEDHQVAHDVAEQVGKLVAKYTGETRG
jgi:hypothetical protein